MIKLITDPTDISNAFNQYFSTIGKKTSDKVSPTEVPPECYIHRATSQFKFTEITIPTVSAPLKKLSVHKCSAIDEIPAKVLKDAA